MTAHAMRAPSSGFSIKKLILRMLVLGFMGVTILYAKTIGVFLKVFVQELMRSPKKTEE